LLAALCIHRDPDDLAAEIGSAGASRLKAVLAEALNEYLRPLRRKRRYLLEDRAYLSRVLRTGTDRAREMAGETLAEVREAMGMRYA
jgi:tryptophanyl-tRNA synthetase